MLMFALLAPASASAASTTRIIVKREPGLSAAERADIRADAGVRLVDTLSLPRTEVVTAPSSKASTALRELNADDDVVYAERDQTVYALDDPDPLFNFQWALNNTGQPTPTYDEDGNPIFIEGTDDADMDVLEAWEHSVGRGQLVAVVDSGVEAEHDDLAGNVTQGYDWVDRDTTANDPNGHGTHVAGIIAAERGGPGVVGVAPMAHVLPLRVLGATGTGPVSSVAEAFDFAGDQHVRVVNASLGQAAPSNTQRDAIAEHRDTLYVLAAGNNGVDNDASSKREYPCSYNLDNIICVGASDADDTRPSFSNYGATTVDLFAPGDRIFSTYKNDGYAIASGTSAAAPQVAGEAALILARNPGLDIAAVKAAILTSGDPKPDLVSVTGRRANANEALNPDLVRPDQDGDGFADDSDNCPTVTNPAQDDDDCGLTAPDPDSDRDSVPDDTDDCPYDAGSPLRGGCPGLASNSDTDPQLDIFDNCPTTENPDQTDLDRDALGDACDADDDGDARNDGPDNCDRTYNPSQSNLDGDAAGDACDADDDNDGRPDTSDQCPTKRAFTTSGCPVVVTAPRNADGDSLVDSGDACPMERAFTANGCPLPYVTALAAKGRKRAATIVVHTSRAAIVRITVQRKRGHKWVRVKRKTLASSHDRATLKLRKLRRGSYRVAVVVSSSAGTAAPAAKRFRVR